ncbi:hypothetical protein Nepgr_027635 [Nepenthes gracilis]|uniref:Uncharacterized protein n=1 Tax=Nepenthes gracilis TaxID=150966 RepID=A0AAD3TAF9_NEPGR|nr:hypothetical protein Nepgr_027635 [Nepenthes gracilis]
MFHVMVEMSRLEDGVGRVLDFGGNLLSFPSAIRAIERSHLREGRKVDVPPIDVGLEGVKNWEHTLVGYFLGKKPAFSFVKLRLEESGTSEGLSFVANTARVPLFTDSQTENLSRIGFARFCVDVKVNFQLPNSIALVVGSDPASRNEIFLVIAAEHSRKPTYYKGCNCYGHSNESYLSNRFSALQNHGMEEHRRDLTELDDKGLIWLLSIFVSRMKLWAGKYKGNLDPLEGPGGKGRPTKPYSR